MEVASVQSRTCRLHQVDEIFVFHFDSKYGESSEDYVALVFNVFADALDKKQSVAFTPATGIEAIQEAVELVRRRD